jgi:hypothetical protein
VKKVIVVVGVTLIIMLVAWHQSTVSVLLELFIAGHIPGTSVTIPFWVMMAVYCLLITLLMTNYIEEAFAFRRDAKKLSTSKTRMPRRRYGQI